MLEMNHFRYAIRFTPSSVAAAEFFPCRILLDLIERLTNNRTIQFDYDSSASILGKSGLLVRAFWRE